MRSSHHHGTGVTSRDAKVLTFRLRKADWFLSGGGLSANLRTTEGGWRIDANAVTSFDTTTLRSRARYAEQSYTSDGLRATRRPDRPRRACVVEASDDESLDLELGSLNNGFTVSLRFDFPAHAPMAREWIESVLASIAYV